MGKTFRETLAEQLKDPEFKKVWDAGATERERFRSLQFDSSLIMEEMEHNLEDVDNSSGIMEGLTEVLATEK